MIQSVIHPDIRSTVPVYCLLLVEEDDPIVDQITALLDGSYSLVRFGKTSDALHWLNSEPHVDLIVTDKTSGPIVAQQVRKQVAYQSVPILIACRSIKPQLQKAAILSGVTDLLLLPADEDDYSLQSKIHYYLELKTQVLATPAAPEHLATSQLFTLPWWKRSIDIAVSLTILLILSPLLLLVALIIKLDSKGPVLYKSKRAGTNFYVFNMYKYRTMKLEADQQINNLISHNIYATPATDPKLSKNLIENLCDECRLKGITCQQSLFDKDQLICEKVYLRENEEAAKFMKFRNDPRITRFGTFLRNSSIDELPQLLNILLGDMSLVGNRPLPLYEAEKLTSDEFAQRFAGPAGLTGLWQVTKRAKGQGAMSDRERALLDIEYARTFSFKTDMYILWKTFFSLWQKENV